MRGRWPGLIVENCSSDSLRQDYATVALTDTHWVSDGVEQRFAVPYMMGATFFMPPPVCFHWTVDPTGGDPAMSFDAQFLANLMGHFGLSGRHGNLSEQPIYASRSLIRLSKQIRPLLCRAEVFHLTEPWEDGPQGALYRDAATGKELLFAFQCGFGFPQCALGAPSGAKAA